MVAVLKSYLKGGEKMVTSIEKVEVLFASGRSRAYPVAIEFYYTACIEFNLNPKLGITAELMYSGLPGGNMECKWQYDKVKGASVLVPMSVLRNGKDDVVSITTSTGSSWVLDGEEYVSVANNGSDFCEPVADFDADNFKPASANEKEDEKEFGGRELD